MASVSEWLMSNPSYYLGNSGDDTYYRVPKADGGYDYFRLYWTPEGVHQDSAISLTDLQKVFPQYQETVAPEAVSPAASTYDGLSREEINQRKIEHENRMADYDSKRKLTDRDFLRKYEGVEQSLKDLATSRDEGLDSNLSYFNNVSPEAFQSQIGNYNQKVLGAYNEGVTTANKNRDDIKLSEEAWLSELNRAINAEKTFNPTTGLYTNPYTYNRSIAPNEVTLAAYNASLPRQQAAQLNPNKTWTPNYGGLSTQQAKADPNDPYNFIR